MQPSLFAALTALSIALLAPAAASTPAQRQQQAAASAATPAAGATARDAGASASTSPRQQQQAAPAAAPAASATARDADAASGARAGAVMREYAAVPDTSQSLQKAVRELAEPRSEPQAVSAEPFTVIGGIPVPADDYAQGMIRKYIAQYTTSYGRQELYKTLDDAERYRLYVHGELARRGMPAALEYLPVVESSYKPLATSRSGARGLWQFMENSIARLLHKDEWVDERLDPWLSTDAALRKLQDNYAMFRNWELAIAAYNCGAGAMSAILKKAPRKSFWYVAENGLLRDQSVQYVPKLLAICELSEHGELYGVTLPAVPEERRLADFDYLRVSGQLWLDRLESELRLQSGTLSALNPALLRGCTPPKQDYTLRLPAGTAQAALVALAGIYYGASGPAPRGITHTVAAGDTLYAISRRYGCTVEALCAANALGKNTVLSVGKTLYIPLKSAETK